MNIDFSKVSKEFEELEELSPPEIENLVQIPFDPDIYMCGESYTRWRKTNEGLVRDHDGETDWQEMAKYVDKTYNQVFMETYNKYAKSK